MREAVKVMCNLSLGIEEEALKRGMEKGLEKGQQEALQRTAQNMKAMQISTDVIMKATGMTSEEIEQL